MSPTKWINSVNSIGMVTKAGKHGGGTYAHFDIAMEFASWISPEFKLYIVTEFKRMKEKEQRGLGWNLKRTLSKINYNINTDIRDYANVAELVCLVNLENLNSVYINEGINSKDRLVKLNNIAIHQMTLLTEDNRIKKIENIAKDKKLYLE